MPLPASAALAVEVLTSIRDTSGAPRMVLSRTYKDLVLRPPGLMTVEGIADTGGGSAAWFKDTEGNTMGVLPLNS
jgi:hypothetical protein